MISLYRNQITDENVVEFEGPLPILLGDVISSINEFCNRIAYDNKTKSIKEKVTYAEAIKYEIIQGLLISDTNFKYWKEDYENGDPPSKRR